MTRIRLIAVAFVAALLWLRRGPRCDRIVVREASTSVSWENYLEERDEEQVAWDEREGLNHG